MRRNSLPDFLIIGSARCGTSSLHRNLLAHSKLIGPDPLEFLRGAMNYKEVHFFDREHKWKRGDVWYRNFWKVVPEGYLCFESTPNYLYESIVPMRVKEILPAGKFIAILRNPVDRAWSHFCRWKRKLKLNSKDVFIRPNNVIIKKGIYHKQLKRWLEIFDRDQFLILRSEDFFTNPEKILKDVFRWLGMDPVIPPVIKRWDPIEDTPWRDDPYPKIPPELRKKLKAFYRPYNQELEELIGKRMGWGTTAVYKRKVRE